MKEGFSFGLHLLFTAINFFLLVIAIFLFARKRIGEGIRERGRRIKEELLSLKREKEEIERTRREYLEKLNGVDKEIEEMKRRAIEEMDRLVEGMKRKIIDSSKRWEESIERLLEVEHRRAINSVREEVVDIAVEIAKKKLMERLGEEQERMFFQQALSLLKR